MGDLFYRCGSCSEVIELDGPVIFAETALGIRARKLRYTLGYRNILSRSRPARAAAVDVTFTDMDEADRVTLLMDADFDLGMPGTLVDRNGWEQRAYLGNFDPTILTPTILQGQLECLLLDGAWMKAKELHLFPSSGDATGTKRRPYRYPYRYASEYGVRAITVDSRVPVAFRMCIFGYVRNPNIRIANNVYRFDLTVEEGGYLLVDSRDCSATLVGRLGNKENVYGSCLRGTGEGCGTYAWERIPPGTSLASWNDTFGFDLTLYETMSAPPYGGGT